MAIYCTYTPDRYKPRRVLRFKNRESLRDLANELARHGGYFNTATPTDTLVSFLRDTGHFPNITRVSCKDLTRKERESAT